MEQRLKEGPSVDSPMLESIMSADIKPDTVGVVKMCFLTDISFFIFYILCLHCKCFPLSWFTPPNMSHKPSSFHPFPNHACPISLFW